MGQVARCVTLRLRRAVMWNNEGGKAAGLHISAADSRPVVYKTDKTANFKKGHFCCAAIIIRPYGLTGI